MKYYNPVLRGMYPDPSVCSDGNKYYMVCSTFEFFPGVPVFESEDMINWKQIGHCLTRPEQIALDKVRCSGGVFAPTIRYHKGRFYMVTTNDSTRDNFYVYTDNIYGEWSDPIHVEQDGIDPSLYFEDDRAFFMSNGSDEDGRGVVQMCEIDINTGKKISETRYIWHGTGGRFLEAPHLYKFGDWYYLLEAEGGTEYGHMTNYARSKSMWEGFEPYPHNPVLTNRNLGGYALQAAGHGDIIQDKNGKWWFVHLAFRQSGMWMQFHHLGRETCVMPLEWDEDGWFSIGNDGTSRLEVEVYDRTFAPQNFNYRKSFEDLDWNYLRIPVWGNYELTEDKYVLTGTTVTLGEEASPTFIGVRQDEFDVKVDVTVAPGKQEAGITCYMSAGHHYELACTNTEAGTRVELKASVGCINTVIGSCLVKSEKVKLRIVAKPLKYNYYVIDGNEEIYVGSADTKLLSSEVAMGFTGIYFGLYAIDAQNKGEKAEFTNFVMEHTQEA